MRKAQGVRRGVPDFMLYEGCFSPRFQSFRAHPTNPSWGLRIIPCTGLAIEFKSPTGAWRVSPEQKAWHNGLRENGWRVEVVKSAETAWEIVAEYLGFDP